MRNSQHFLKYSANLCVARGRDLASPCREGSAPSRQSRPSKMDEDCRKWLSLRVVTPRLASPGKATGRAQFPFCRRAGRGPLQFPQSSASRADGAVLLPRGTVLMADETREKTLGPKRPAWYSGTAARRSALIDATAPRNPPRAAKISYLKIDRLLRKI